MAVNLHHTLLRAINHFLAFEIEEEVQLLGQAFKVQH